MSIMDEVAEDLQREQLKIFWAENRAWIIGGCLLAVLMTGGMTFWRGYAYRQDVAATTVLLEAAQTPDLQKLQSYSAGGRNHAAIAKFAAAGVHVKARETDKAVSVYKEIENTRGTDRVLRDLAAVLRLSLILDTAEVKNLHADLKKLSGRNNAWRFFALELQALVYARENKTQEAVEVLTNITSDPEAPLSAKTRASTLRELYAGSQDKPNEGK